MPNFQCANDTNYAFPILTANAAGVTVPAPAGDKYTVTTTIQGALPNLCAIGLMPDGVTPALLVNAAGAPLNTGITADVTDASGLQMASFTFDIVQDVVPAELIISTAGVSETVI